MLINFIVGLVLMLVSLILDTAFNSTPSIADTNKVLKWFYRFSPGFCLGNGLLDMAFSSAGISFGQGSSPTLLVGPTNPIDWSHSGRDIFFLFFSAPIFLGPSNLLPSSDSSQFPGTCSSFPLVFGCSSMAC